MYGFGRIFRFLIIAAFFALLGSGCISRFSPSQNTSSVSGKITFHRLPAPGVKAFAYPLDVLSLNAPPRYLSSETGEDGLFKFDLPAGEYYVFVKGKGLFSFYGRNPVVVPPEGVRDLNLPLVRIIESSVAQEPLVTTGIMGNVYYDGAPLSGATIYIYTDLTSRLKGMGYAMAGPTDENGFFEVELPAGSYYIMARSRRDGGGTGPLRAGDFIGYYPGNPVTVDDGKIHSSSFSVLEVPEKADTMRESLFGQTALHGRLIDPSGHPVEGGRAVLYSDPRMLDRPLYVSAPTGPDGLFVISFPHGGTYYLAARNSLGGAPSPGDLYGTYDGSPYHSLKIETGDVVEDLEIVMEEMW